MVRMATVHRNALPFLRHRSPPEAAEAAGSSGASRVDANATERSGGSGPGLSIIEPGQGFLRADDNPIGPRSAAYPSASFLSTSAVLRTCRSSLVRRFLVHALAGVRVTLAALAGLHSRQTHWWQSGRGANDVLPERYLACLGLCCRVDEALDCRIADVDCVHGQWRWLCRGKTDLDETGIVVAEGDRVGRGHSEREPLVSNDRMFVKSTFTLGSAVLSASRQQLEGPHFSTSSTRSIRRMYYERERSMERLVDQKSLQDLISLLSHFVLVEYFLLPLQIRHRSKDERLETRASDRRIQKLVDLFLGECDEKDAHTRAMEEALRSKRKGGVLKRATVRAKSCMAR